MDSHSTMYLLKHVLGDTDRATEAAFTFHHVSIKTEEDWDTVDLAEYSHSTMYLLKHRYVY